MIDQTNEKMSIAENLFDEGMNCAQASFFALAKNKADAGTIFSVASCFGGGMRCGEVCGAVTGSLMAIGLQHGYTSPQDTKGKQRASRLALDFEKRFKEKNGSLLCRDLLGYDLSDPEQLARIQAEGLFKTICPRMVKDAVCIAEAVLNQEEA